MKKIGLFVLLLPFLAVSGLAQESRQDISFGVTGIFPPFVSSSTNVQQTGTNGLGGLLSYRYMVTPRSALELNYQYAQNANKYTAPFIDNYRVHTRMQEISAAYVYNFTFRNWNPFAEAGVGGFLFSPIQDTSTTNLDFKRTTNIGALYGGGISYEISPSFDIRAEYRGIVVKTPNFGVSNLSTNRYYNINNPVIGVAYHF
jgi:outer membrane immunogenic protein